MTHHHHLLLIAKFALAAGAALAIHQAQRPGFGLVAPGSIAPCHHLQASPIVLTAK